MEYFSLIIEIPFWSIVQNWMAICSFGDFCRCSLVFWLL